MPTWIRRHRLVAAAALTAVIGVAGALAVMAYAVDSGFDEATVTRASGDGAQVVRVALVDRAIGYDVSPDVVEIDRGTHLVIEVVNEADGVHDLAVDDHRTALLTPGESERLDLGEVTADTSGRCTIPDHDLAGMALTVTVT